MPPEEPPKPEVKDEGQDLYATAESEKKLAELQASSACRRGSYQEDGRVRCQLRNPG